MQYPFTRIDRATIIRRKSFKPPYRNHVTASKLAAFAHQDDFATAGLTAVRVFARKEMPEPSSFSYKAIDHGNQNEAHAARFIRSCPFFSDYEFELTDNDGTWSITGTWRENATRKCFMFSATPDMLIQDRMGVLVPVEIKCPYKAWIEGLDLTTSFMKPSHWLQLIAQMLLTGSKKGFLCVYMPMRSARPEQAIVWEVKLTRAAHDYVLNLVNETYDKISICSEPEDFKKAFRAKNGEKKVIRDFIDLQMKNQTTIKLRYNC